MKFLFEYRTRDNVHHDGVINAPTRDAAYAALRAQGIRPGTLVEAPGFINKVFGKGKRWIAIGILCVFSISLCLAIYVVNQRYEQRLYDDRASETAPLVRRQIYGDPALMDRYEDNGYATIFAHEGDRVLAHFSQPGNISGYIALLNKGGDIRDRAVSALESLRLVLGDEYAFPVGEPREAVELRRIVLWMRHEFKAYLGNGNGNPSSYLRRLIERQRQENDIYSRAERELENVKDVEVWERRNESLRAIGIRTIPMPSDNSRES